MKLTKRRNGKLMVTVSVKHHIDFEDAALALAYKAMQEDWDDNHRSSGAELDRTLRELLWSRGADWSMHASDSLYDGDAGEDSIRWAKSEIKRLHPEWS